MVLNCTYTVCMHTTIHHIHCIISPLCIYYILYILYICLQCFDTAVGRQAHAYTACIVLVTLCNKYWQIDCHYIFCILVWSCLQCFDTVGWAAGRASSL